MYSSHSSSSGISKVREYLQKECNWSLEQAQQIPAKWIKYGDVIMLETQDIPSGDPDHVLRAFNRVYDNIQCILLHQGPITGELRKPQTHLFTPNKSPITLHVENGIKYKVCITVTIN